MRPRRLVLHCALVVLDVAFAAAVLEGWIRFELAAGRKERRVASHDARPRVLFLGDSHFYGLWMDESRTMPALAEAFSQECDRQGFVAINKARSGATTWILLDDARAAIPELKPMAVVVRGGLMNRFFVDPRRANWWESLYITGILKIGLRDVRNWIDHVPPIDPLDDAGVGRARDEMRGREEGHDIRSTIVVRGPSIEEARDYASTVSGEVVNDLTELGRFSTSLGVPVYYVSYLLPSDVLDLVSRDLAAAAAATGSTFVDVRPLTIEALTKLRRGDITLHDGHPTALGYALEARALVAAMVRDGLLSGPEPEDPLTWLARQPLEPTPEKLRAEASVALDAAAPRWTYVVKGKPGGHGTLYIGAFGEGVPVATELLALREEDVVRCGGDRRFQFVLDARGEARITIETGGPVRIDPSLVATAVVYGVERPTPSVAVAPYIVATTGERWVRPSPAPAHR